MSKLATTNLAELTDEELLNVDPSTLPEAETLPSEPAVEEQLEELSLEHAEQEGVDEQPELADATPAATGDEDSTEESKSELPDLRQVYYSDGDKSAQAVDDEEATELAETQQADAASIDYRAEYEYLFSPLKAAKREIRVQSVDDARRLMQMGVDYSRKMEALKPHQRAIKTLERNDLLDPEKINFMIDLVQKKNPEAIKKFLKDSEIDPYELSTDEDTPDYKPNDYIVPEHEMAIEEVLTDIRSTDSYDRTVDVITNKWDTASKQALVQQPEILRAINEQIGMGLYDQIMNVVEQERLFGRLQGLSDLAAYKVVGDAINAKGGFDPYRQQGTSTTNSPQVSGSRSDKNEQLRNRKRAASPTRGSAVRSKEVTNFLESLSDEEIEAMGPPVL